MATGGGPTPLSSANPRLAHLRRLQGRRRARLDAGQMVVEGPVVIAEALASGVALVEVFVDGERFDAAAPGSPLAEAVVAASAAGVSVHRLEPGVLDRLSDTVTAQGALAVAPRPSASLAEVVAGAGPVLVLVGVADPGNAGTLVRAAEASGAAGVVVCGGSVDVLTPKAVRASAGSVLRLPLAEADDPLEVVEALRRERRTVVATVAAGGAAPEDCELAGPVGLLLGSEAHGLPDPVVAAADATVTIPMEAAVESLNAAVAGAVVLFEAARQRRAAAAATDWTDGGAADRLADR